MTEVIYHYICSISNRLIGITLWILGLNSNLLFIMNNINISVRITDKRHGCMYRVYARLIGIILLIYTKLLCFGSGITDL